MATAASSTVIGTSPNSAAARDSYQSAPAAAVSTSNHASTANKVALTAAAAARYTERRRSKTAVSTSPAISIRSRPTQTDDQLRTWACPWRTAPSSSIHAVSPAAISRRTAGILRTIRRSNRSRRPTRFSACTGRNRMRPCWPGAASAASGRTLAPTLTRKPGSPPLRCRGRGHSCSAGFRAAAAQDLSVLAEDAGRRHA